VPPPLSWAPVAVGLFGIGDEPVIFLVAAAAVWPIVLNTAAGVHAVDPGHILVARSLGARRGEILGSVVLPSARGHLLTGLRLALGIAWVVPVPAEMLGVTSGSGAGPGGRLRCARPSARAGRLLAVPVG
jgi:NitT/TauT family transport system permease protein